MMKMIRVASLSQLQKLLLWMNFKMQGNEAVQLRKLLELAKRNRVDPRQLLFIGLEILTVTLTTTQIKLNSTRMH